MSSHRDCLPLPLQLLACLAKMRNRAPHKLAGKREHLDLSLAGCLHPAAAPVKHVQKAIKLILAKLMSVYKATHMP